MGSQGEKPDAGTAHHWGEKLVNVPSRGGYLTELVTGRPTGHCWKSYYHSSRNHTDSWKNSPVWVRGLYGSELSLELAVNLRSMLYPLFGSYMLYLPLVLLIAFAMYSLAWEK